MNVQQRPGRRLLLHGFACFLAALLSSLIAYSQNAAHPEPDTEMIRIPDGEFTMGSNAGPDDERPAHRVKVAAFRIDRNPVTNSQFAAFLNARGIQDDSGNLHYEDDDSDARIHELNGKWIPVAAQSNHPSVEPTWLGAREYCAWRGKRLPTEAEWERAARGDDGRRYPWGNEPPDPKRARYRSGWNSTAPLGSHPGGASPYGVLDMAGNAWEWVSSAYRPYPYSASDGRENPAPGPVRGTRGGGQDSSADEITTTQRGRNLSRNPLSGHHNIGFRCAQSLTTTR